MQLRDLLQPIFQIYNLRFSKPISIYEKTKSVFDAAFGCNDMYDFDAILGITHNSFSSDYEKISNWFNNKQGNPSFARSQSYRKLFITFLFDDHTFISCIENMIENNLDILVDIYKKANPNGFISEVFSKNNDLLSLISNEFMKLTNTKKESSSICKNNSLSSTRFIVQKDNYCNRSGYSVSSLFSGSSKEATSDDITIQYDDGTYIGEYTVDINTGQIIPHGFGKRNWVDGSSYTGEFVRGIRCGKGTFIRENGSIIESLWKDNIRDGHFVTITDDATYYGYEDASHSNIYRIAFKDGFIFDGTITVNNTDGVIYHPDKGSGSFYHDDQNGLKIINYENDEILRTILSFPFNKSYRINGMLEYKGEIKDNLPHGYGKTLFPNNMTLFACYEKGDITRPRGLWIFPPNQLNGLEIECTWDGASWNGSGEIAGLFSENLDVSVIFDMTLDYYGNYKTIKAIHEDGGYEYFEFLPNNQVSYSHSNGEEYEGDVNWLWRKGFARGKYKDTEGSIFEGEWIDGFRHGEFKILFPDGIYDNIFFDKDIPFGICIIKFFNGAICEFKWENGNYNGICKFTYPDSSIYEGAFDGIPCGYGQLVCPDGEVCEGIWKDGRLEENNICIDLKEKWGICETLSKPPDCD